MDTLPMPLNALAAAHGGLDHFRLGAPREIALLLKQLADANVTINLNGSDGGAASTTIWAIDTARNKLSLSVDLQDPKIARLLECDEVVAVAYLDSIKLQFDLQHLVLVRGAAGATLSTDLPHEMFRFQRRNAYRVRPLLRSTPLARLRHPALADMPLALRVLDVSIGGCALFLPDDVPPLEPGVAMNQVLIELDADTRFSVDLQLQHVTSINPESHGVRLGCEFGRTGPDMERALQRFIDQTQKRRKLMALE